MTPDGADRFGSDAFYIAIGRAFVVMCAVVPVLFAVELLDRLVPIDLEAAGGIWPQHLAGLDGVVFAPFLHDEPSHLYGNAVILIPLGTFVFATGMARAVGVTAVIMLASGLGVWFTSSPNAIVIGASGVVFGYLGFLLTRALVERSWWAAGVALLIGLLYGWQLVGLLPTDERISWQGHLFGFGGGVLAAILLQRRRPDRPPVPPEPLDSTLDLPRTELP